MDQKIIFEKRNNKIYYITEIDFLKYKFYTLFDSVGNLFEVSFFNNNKDTVDFSTLPKNTFLNIKNTNTQFKDYFSRKTKVFDILISAEVKMTDFAKEVLFFLKNEVEYGTVISYKDLALKMKKPNHARPIASVMSNNTLPIYFPCHRVIKSNYKLGEYGLKILGNEGRTLKADLINLENNHQSSL